MPLMVMIYHSSKETVYWLCLWGLWHLLYPRKRTSHNRCSSLRCESMAGVAIQHVGHWHCTDYVSESYDISSTKEALNWLCFRGLWFFLNPRKRTAHSSLSSSLCCESMTGVATLPPRVMIYHPPRMASKGALNWLCFRGLWFFLYPRKRTAH